MGMSADVSDFRWLASVARRAEPAIRKELYAGVSRAVRPVRQEIPASARQTLPKSGGLAEWAASAKVTTRQAYSGKAAGASIEVSKPKTRTARVKTAQAALIGPLPKGQTRTRTTRRRRAGTFGTRADLGALDRGRVMHPTWGRGPLVGPQAVPTGFASRVFEGPVAARAEQEVLAALGRAVDRVLARR